MEGAKTVSLKIPKFDPNMRISEYCRVLKTCRPSMSDVAVAEGKNTLATRTFAISYPFVMVSRADDFWNEVIDALTNAVMRVAALEKVPAFPMTMMLKVHLSPPTTETSGGLHPTTGLSPKINSPCQLKEELADNFTRIRAYTRQVTEMVAIWNVAVKLEVINEHVSARGMTLV